MKIMSEEQKLKIAESVRRTKALNRPKTLQRRLEKKLQQKSKLVDYIICPLCLRETNNEILSRIRLMTKSHLLRHNYSFEKFKTDFPDCETATKLICNNQSLKLSGEHHFNYGKVLSVETKNKISNSNSKFCQEHSKVCNRCGKLIYSKHDLCKRCRKNKFSTVDAYDGVYCRICNIVKKDLSGHIKYDHNLTKEQYKLQFGAPICCEEYSQKISNSRQGIVLNDQHRNSISTTLNKTHAIRHTNKLTWEQSFNKNDWLQYTNRDMTSLIDNDDFIYCRIRLQKMQRLSSEHLALHNMTASMYNLLFADAPLIAKNIIKNITIKMMTTKVNRGINIGNNWGYYGYRRDIGHFVRSMIEANFCRMLKLNNIRYEYELRAFIR